MSANIVSGRAQYVRTSGVNTPRHKQLALVLGQLEFGECRGEVDPDLLGFAGCAHG